MHSSFKIVPKMDVEKLVSTSDVEQMANGMTSPEELRTERRMICVL